MALTITLGNIIQIAATVLTIFAAYVRLSERLTRVETKVDVLMERRRQPRD